MQFAVGQQALQHDGVEAVVAGHQQHYQGVGQAVAQQGQHGLQGG